MRAFWASSSHVASPASPPATFRKKLALRASITSELHFDEVRLPADAVLPGVTGLKGPLSCLSQARFGIIWGATALGVLRLRGGVRADARAVRPSDRQVQLTQSKLAWMASDLIRPQLLALHLGRLEEAGPLRPNQVSLGKMTCVRTAIDIARQARTILGANGITLEYPVIRHANNLEAVLTSRAPRRSTNWRSARPSLAWPPIADGAAAPGLVRRARGPLHDRADIGTLHGDVPYRHITGR